MTALTGPAESASGAYTATFQALAAELDALNALRERLVKASRDTTQASKKLIFALHRAPPAGTPAHDLALAAAQTEASRVRALIAVRIAGEIDGDDCYARLQRAFSPGLQEYVEAALLLGYMDRGVLVPREELEHELRAACAAANVGYSMPIDSSDYVLGAADLTGELMRLAVGAAANGDVDTPFRIRAFLDPLLGCFEGLLVRGRGPLMRDLPGKIAVFRQSLAKVERTCFDITMRRAEFGDGIASASSNVRTLSGAFLRQGAELEADDVPQAKRQRG
jgi:predicted translin family RNA/ssDNA-binding protein